MPFQFSKFISIDPMRDKGWMTRSIVKVSVEEIGLPPVHPNVPSIHPHPYNDSKRINAERDHHLAVEGYLSEIKTKYKEEILDLVMYKFHDLLLDLNPELEIEPELNVMTQIMNYSPAFHLPQVHGEWAYLDVTAWIYDESDPGSPLFLEV